LNRLGCAEPLWIQSSLAIYALCSDISFHFHFRQNNPIVFIWPFHSFLRSFYVSFHCSGLKMKVLLGLSVWTVYGGVVVVGAASESSDTTRKLDQTPTWAVAGICAVIIIISILLEKILHKVGTVSFLLCVFNAFL